MPTPIYLVKVGMTMTEGMVEEWYVADGERVEAGELLYRLETEKVNLDVDAEASGIVKHGVEIGVMLEPGDVIGHIYAPDEAIPTGAPTAAATAPVTAPAPVDAPEPRRPTAASLPSGRVAASPAARRLARELGIDCATLAGSGPRGRIVEADVQRAAERQRSAATRPTPAAAAASTIPLTGMRKTIAARMYESLRSSAQLTMDMDVAMDDAVKLRAQLVDEWASEQIRPSYTDLVIRAAAKALPAHPLLNASFGEREITVHGAVHVGVAVAVPDGLVVPVIRDANGLSLKEISATAARFAEAARTGSLTLDDMSGGTFTVSALGMFGVDSFTPILNTPQSAILGVNRIRDDVAWQNDRAVPVKRMRLSLTWDHRVLDGAPAAAFLAAVRDLLQGPYRLLV